MIKDAWWTKRKVGRAAKTLQHALSLIELASDACHKQPREQALATDFARQTKKLVEQARAPIEALPNLSFNAQNRFFRIFEWVEECLDYATESMVYEEFDTACIDLTRATKGIEEAISLLCSQMGLRSPSKPTLRVLIHRIGMRSTPKSALPTLHRSEVLELPIIQEENEEAHKHRTVMLL